MLSKCVPILGAAIAYPLAKTGSCLTEAVKRSLFRRVTKTEERSECVSITAYRDFAMHD